MSNILYKRTLRIHAVERKPAPTVTAKELVRVRAKLKVALKEIEALMAAERDSPEGSRRFVMGRNPVLRIVPARHERFPGEKA